MNLHAMFSVVFYVSVQLGFLGFAFFFLIFFTEHFTILRIPAVLYLCYVMLFGTRFKSQRSTNYFLQYFASGIFDFFDADLISDFPVDIVNDGVARKFIIGVHPHGVFGFGHSLLVFGWQLGKLQRLMPFIKDLRHAAIRMMFYVPFCREMSILLGLIPCDKNSLMDCLQSGKSITIVVGGAAEALYSGDDESIVLVLKNRLGFVKLAVESGASLVPCLVFGEKHTYRIWHSRFTDSIQRFLINVVGISTPIILPNYGFIPFLPRRWKLVAVIGKPLYSLKLAATNPQYDSEVDKLHSKYIESLVELHAKYKHLGSTQEQNLKIISSK